MTLYGINIMRRNSDIFEGLKHGNYNLLYITRMIIIYSLVSRVLSSIYTKKLIYIQGVTYVQGGWYIWFTLIRLKSESYSSLFSCSVFMIIRVIIHY